MPRKLFPILAAGLLLGLGLWLYRVYRPSLARGQRVWQFFSDPASHPELVLTAGTRCGAAPFLFPTTGLIGFIWDDSFRPGHRHQGIDIFARGAIGQTPVLAAYPGFF